MRLNSLIIISFCFLCMFGNNGKAKKEINSIFQNRYISNSPGGAIIISKGDKIIYEDYKGISDYDDNSYITKDTRFNIASVSKQFTAISILILQERELLNVEDKIVKYLPYLNDSVFGRVKIKHLLSHSSGIPDERPRNDRNWVLTATDKESVKYLKDVKALHFTPGTCYEYINPTFQILYTIIESLTKENFVNFQQREIFDKLEMKNTYYFDANDTHNNVTHGYICNGLEESNDRDSSIPSGYGKIFNTDSNGIKWYQYDYGEETFFATKADGGIYSTPRDILKWHNGLKSSKLISKKLLKEAYLNHTKVSDSKLCLYQNRPNTYYGYGFFIDKTPGYPVKIYHTGDNGGYQAYVAYYPESDVSIILLENRNDKDRWSFAKQIDQILMHNGLLK